MPRVFRNPKSPNSGTIQGPNPVLLPLSALAAFCAFKWLVAFSTDLGLEDAGC